MSHSTPCYNSISNVREPSRWWVVVGGKKKRYNIFEGNKTVKLEDALSYRKPDTDGTQGRGSQPWLRITIIWEIWGKKKNHLRPGPLTDICPFLTYNKLKFHIVQTNHWCVWRGELGHLKKCPRGSNVQPGFRTTATDEGRGGAPSFSSL